MGNCQDSSAVSNVSNPTTSFQGLRIACLSWNNTYNNLFDYSADDSAYTKRYIHVNKSCQVVKESANQFLSAELDSQKGNGLFEVVEKDIFKYVLTPCINTSKLTANQLWLIVKTTPSKKYKLKEGDIMRIGKQRVKVKEIILDDKEVQEEIADVKTKFRIYQTMTKEKSDGFDPTPEDKPICRVCLDEGELDNPLIAPCKCSGSAKYIHIKCIQEWFNKTINPRNSNAAIIISWKPLVCQLCHQSLPFKIYLDGQKHFIVNIPRPKKPYLVLNPIDKSSGSTKTYYLVSFSEKKSLNLGRKKDSDIVLDGDSSISRHHTKIQYIEKENQKPHFSISDNESKFGTLILLKKAINLQEKHSGLGFQVGGNMLVLEHGSASSNKKAIDEEDNINASDSASSEEELEDQEEQKKEEQNENRSDNNEIMMEGNVPTNIRPIKKVKK